MLHTHLRSMPLDPRIPPSHETFHSGFVGAVAAYVPERWCRRKLIEWQVELHTPAFVHQVTEQEEVYVPLEALEELEEGRIPFKDIGEGALGIRVETPDALQRQVKPVVDQGVASPRLIDGRQTVDLPLGEDDVRADGGAHIKDLLHLVRYLLREPLLTVVIPVGVGDGITPQRELAQM